GGGWDGGGSKSRQMERFGRDAVCDREGFAVVYPEGEHGHWNDGRGDANGSAPVDDVAFIRTLIDTLAAAYPIDTDRVYATGISNGGIMSYRLACDLSDKIAAIAPVVGEGSESVAQACQPARP